MKLPVGQIGVIMSELLKYLQEFNTVSVLVRVVLAAFFGGIIGLERGRQRRAAGLRTHILVCVGSALTVLVGFYAREVLGVANTDPLRIAAQVISGIGFIGVGTIMLKGKFQVVGLTTAAGLWVSAAIGICCGAGFYEGAFLAFVISVFTVMVLNRIERKINEHRSVFGVYIEIKSDKYVNDCISNLKELYSAHDIQITVPRSGVVGNVGIEASILTGRKGSITLEEVTEKMNTFDYVVFSLESI